MSDFEDMARRHREDSDRRIEEAQRQQEAKAIEERRGREAARLYLETTLIPVLEEAQRAFDKSGVPSTIYKSWENRKEEEEPFVTFFCGGASESDVIRFTGHGNILAVGFDGLSHRIERREEEPEAIRSAVERVLSSYYDHLERRSPRR
jgi:pyruvate/2-oxoacid:ferredoxin oxidoreductase beta subunit